MVLEKIEGLLEEGDSDDMMLLREKLLEKMSDSEKKALLLRFIDARIMRKEARVSSLKDRIKRIEHRVETLRMMKKAIEKM
jgi:hypothetical protein